MVKSKTLQEWVRIPQKSLSDNIINGRIVVTEDDFMVWQLGKKKYGFGSTFADICKRPQGYEIGIGKKGRGGYPFKKTFTDRNVALEVLFAEMKKKGVLKQ